MGLSREIYVRLEATNEMAERGRFEDEFQIISKHEIYTVKLFDFFIAYDRFLLKQKYLMQRNLNYLNKIINNNF